jgi:hypothetical protein
MHTKWVNCPWWACWSFELSQLCSWSYRWWGVFPTNLKHDSNWLLWHSYIILKLKFPFLVWITSTWLCQREVELSFSEEHSIMDPSPAWYQACACGCTFSIIQAYSYHKQSCQKTKRWLLTALEKAKEVWQIRKQRRMEQNVESQAEGFFYRAYVSWIKFRHCSS